MARTTVGEGSRRGNGVNRSHEAGRYARYTEKQIEILEKVYAECSNPNHFQRAEILREQPVLRGVDNNQLKAWFQNRRCRDKQKRENHGLASENRRLTAVNKILRDENDGLLKTLAQLVCDNEHLRNQVLSMQFTSTNTTSDLENQPEANNPQQSIMVADNEGLLPLAEETRKEFISKATGIAVKWIPVPGLKLYSPDSVGTIFVSSTNIGVGARACVKIPLEPLKIIEILKNRPSWSRLCRSMEVIATYPANNGETIELIYTQHYAPTTMACARDFWTLRYTSVLDDGSFVVCEKSISGSDAGPSSPAALEFVRGRMLACGYLIRPSEEGSTIDLVEHLDLEASSVPVAVRPLYVLPELMAKKMIVSALHYIEEVANETKCQQKSACLECPAFGRSFGNKLSRSFNDAVNCFSEDGWSLMNADASDDMIISVKRAKNFEILDSVICVKASLLLQSVSPASVVGLLKERRSYWMGFDFADHSIAFSEAAHLAFPGQNTHNLSDRGAQLGHTLHGDEILEVIRYERIDDYQPYSSTRDIYHVQLSNGKEDNGFGACSELIFAPMDKSADQDAAYLSSGFRIISLGSSTGASSSTNLTSNSSVLILAFQFPFASHLLDDVAAMGREYVQHVISYVKNMSMVPSRRANLEMNSKEADPAMGSIITPEISFDPNRASMIFQSYRSVLGMDMLGINNCESADSIPQQIQNHQHAILCFTFSSLPVCLYSNLAALNMLETTLDNLRTLSVHRILRGSNNLSLASVLPTIMQQGYAMLPPGYCLSVKNRCVSYKQGVVWKVLAPDGSINSLALSVNDWSSV